MDKGLDQLVADGLKAMVRGRPDESGKPLQRRRIEIGIKSNGLMYHGIVVQLKGQIPKGLQTTQCLIDKGLEQGIFGQSRPSTLTWPDGQRWQMLEKRFVSDRWGQNLKRKQTRLSHRILHFREGRPYFTKQRIPNQKS